MQTSLQHSKKPRNRGAFCSNQSNIYEALDY